MTTLLFIAVAYLLGSLSFAVIVSRAMRLPDPRSFGSGNIGATNVLRTGNKGLAALTVLLDGGKGAVAVLVGHLIMQYLLTLEPPVTRPLLAAFMGLGAVLGHLFPVWLGFKGGKGVATAFGVLLGLNPWLGLASLVTWLVMAGVFRISSLAALTTAALAPVYTGLLMGWGNTALVALVIALLLVYRHKSNLVKLISGQETRIGGRPSIK